MKTKLSTKKKIVFTLVVLFVFLIGLEAYARIRTYMASGDPRVFFGTPNSVRRIESNQSGYRGKVVSREKPPNIFRIAALGGSTTFGWGIELDSQTWPAQLEFVLNRSDRKKRFQVLNFGRNHATSVVLLHHRLRLAESYDPDYYVVFSGYNDYDKGFEPVMDKVGPVPDEKAGRIEGQGPQDVREDGVREGAILERLTLLIWS